MQMLAPLERASPPKQLGAMDPSVHDPTSVDVAVGTPLWHDRAAMEARARWLFALPLALACSSTHDSALFDEVQPDTAAGSSVSSASTSASNTDAASKGTTGVSSGSGGMTAATASAATDGQPSIQSNDSGANGTAASAADGTTDSAQTSGTSGGVGAGGSEGTGDATSTTAGTTATAESTLSSGNDTSTTTSGGDSSTGAASTATTDGDVTPSGSGGASASSGTDASSTDAGGTETSCAGTLYDGVCWYLGGSGQSCQQACAEHGAYDEATASYVGTAEQGGSLAACETLLELLGLESPVQQGYREDGAGLGCHVYAGAAAYWLSSPEFSGTIGLSQMRLVCGCTE